jgi:hypothetical protein
MKDFDDCLAVAKEAMIMGWHLMNERSRALMLMAGAQVQADAAVFMNQVYADREDAERSNLCLKYDSQMRRLYNFCEKKMLIIRTPNPNAGDIFYIIRGDKDRTWRVEGLYTLLYLRYRERNHRGNSKAVRDLLSSYSGSDDPYIEAAVSSVLGSTIPDDQIVEWWSTH